MPPPSKAEQARSRESFKAITAIKSDKEAEQYLEACSWMVNAAVELFFARDSGEPATRKRKEPTRPNGRPRNGNGAGPSAPVTLSDDDDVVPLETKRNGGAAAPSRAPAKPQPAVTIDDDDEVRAPMSFKNGPIVQQSFEQQYGNGIRPRAAMPNGIFDGVQDFRALAEQQKAAQKMRLQNGIPALAKREEAASIERECWVLVNVQDMKEFASQTLNRDVWSNGGVKELVRSNFLFWQVSLDTADGQRMRSYYGVRSCPAVFIVDPRTGEKVTDVPLKSQDAVSICDKLTRFMDDFPDFATRDRSIGHAAPEDAEPHPDEAQNMEEMVAESACTSSTSNGTKRKRRAGEEEDETNGKKSRVEDGDMDRLLEESTRGLTMCDEDEWKKHVVPGGDPIRVGLRFPDGSRHAVEVTGATRLFALHQYIRGRGLMPEDHVFILSFPKREYSTDRSEESLSQLGFSRSEMIHVETKE
ncbi:hypothetical protein PRIPAC_76568 [Pristionchus pacificus]|uniref:UBX domain-containing protein n=1 Tax=Pristionchus pacificus TaxID=54126 RepID=A0A2A6BF19_PRIPA|nr:hypothetical protein PRIPAC_76568 [Pristionchus pacificus]|eukprot:PDM64479.1 hypothetical protein PRIPAC_52735 [Pristionchus pacificus]